MMHLTCRCGAALAPHATSCGHCAAGATIPRPRTAWSLGVALGVSVLVVLLAATIAVLALRPTTVLAAAPVASTSVPETATVTVAPPVPASSGDATDDDGYSASDDSGYGDSPGYTADGDAVPGYSAGGDPGSTDTGSTSAALLQEGVDSRRSDVEGLAGQWVPQLSAKKVGTEADGITYDSTAILSHYNGLRASYPDARLLYSGDWPVFTGSDFWVVVAARPFATAAAANAWCDAQGFGADDCLAKKLSHTDGPTGSSVPRS